MVTIFSPLKSIFSHPFTRSFIKRELEKQKRARTLPIWYMVMVSSLMLSKISNLYGSFNADILLWASSLETSSLRRGKFLPIIRSYIWQTFAFPFSSSVQSCKAWKEKCKIPKHKDLMDWLCLPSLSWFSSNLYRSKAPYRSRNKTHFLSKAQLWLLHRGIAFEQPLPSHVHTVKER